MLNDYNGKNTYVYLSIQVSKQGKSIPGGIRIVQLLIPGIAVLAFPVDVTLIGIALLSAQHHNGTIRYSSLTG